MIIPVFNRLITGEAPWSRLLRDSPTKFTFFRQISPAKLKRKRIESFNNRTMKIFETVTPLGDPLNNFQSQFGSRVRTEEFKHIKLVLTNALAKVYTRRLKAFNVHVVCHGKGLYLIKLFPTKVKRPKPRVNLWLAIMSLVKNQKTGFSISDFKNSLQNSIYFVKLALAGFFFSREGFFFLFTLHRTKDELFDKLSKCIYSQTQTNILFFFVPGPGEYFK